MGSSANVIGMTNDPAFLGLSPADQRKALAGLTGDDSFSSLSDQDTQQFVSRMRGTASGTVTGHVAEMRAGTGTAPPPANKFSGSFVERATSQFGQDLNNPGNFIPPLRSLLGVPGMAFDMAKQGLEQWSNRTAPQGDLAEQVGHLGIPLVTAAVMGGLSPQSAAPVADVAETPASTGANAVQDTAAATAKETPAQFVDRLTKGRAQVVPNAQGVAVDAKTGVPVDAPKPGYYRVFDKGKWVELPKQNEFFTETAEGNTIDLRSQEQKQAALNEYYAKHPDEVPKVKMVGRGPNKGQVKMIRVFDQGKWWTVPVYK